MKLLLFLLCNLFFSGFCFVSQLVTFPNGDWVITDTNDRFCHSQTIRITGNHFQVMDIPPIRGRFRLLGVDPVSVEMKLWGCIPQQYTLSSDDWKKQITVRSARGKKYYVLQTKE